MRIGYFLSCEEFTPRQLVDQARLAEEVGFDALWISDHFHPWNDNQGQSAFVWSVIGAISEVCDLPVTTAVTCPTVRTHPAIIAQAAATSAVMLEGRFTLGLGSGEALNEHVFGDPWPTADVRLAMLDEAVTVIRALWSGETITHNGPYYTVDTARLYTRPEEPPPIYISGFGPKATDLAAEIADGYINTSPDKEMVSQFKDGSGGKPAQAGFKVCYAPTEDEAVDIAHRLWANSGVPGELAQVLPSPKHFEQVSTLVTKEMTRESAVCGPDTERHVDAFAPFAAAGYDEVYVANMGPNYEAMLRMYGDKVLPALRADDVAGEGS